MPPFAAYFKHGRRIPSAQGNIRFETSEGEKLEIHIAVLLLSYSRFRFYHMSITRSQAVLMSFLIEAFESLGGVPHEILTENMKSIMDEARTECGGFRLSNRQRTDTYERGR